MSQATQQYRQLALATPLGEDRLLLTSFSGREEMSRLFSFHLEMLSTDEQIRAADLVGKGVTIAVRRLDGSLRYFNGCVRQFSAGPMTRTGKYRQYRAEVVPWLWFLTRTADCRIFQNKNVPDIIEQIFQDLGFSDFDRSRLKGSYPERVYCVQYRETDFNFVSRLMEEEGIFYYFAHENGKHTLVMADGTTGYHPCDQATIKYHQTETFHTAEERVTQWEHRYEYRSGKWAHTDYNFETPQTSLMANEPTVVDLSGNKNYEVYDYPGEHENVGEGRRLVRIRMQEEEAGFDTTHGESTCRLLSPGEQFTLADYEADSENNQKFVVTSVEHEAIEPSYYETTLSSDNGEERPHYQNQFTCIPASVTFRPERTTRQPVVEGPQTAVIVGPPGEEIYPDEYGRVKVQFHWDREGKRDENSSCWIRVSQMHAGKGWGYMDLPRIGEEVIVDFLEGNPDQPIITGRVYNADNMPPFALPAGKTRRGNMTKTYKGSGYNEMSMDDTPGAEQIRIHGQHNMDSVVENNKTLLVGVDRSSEVGNNDSLKVAVNRVKAVGNDEANAVGNNQTTDVGNHVVINAGTSITLKCGASCIHMNQAGVISITGTLITTAAAIMANVAAPLTTISGLVVLSTGAAAHVTTGALNQQLGGMVNVDGGTVNINCL